MKLWRVTVEKRAEDTVWIAAETKTQAENAACEAAWLDSGDVGAFAREIADPGCVPAADLKAEVYDADSDPIGTVAEFFAQKAPTCEHGRPEDGPCEACAEAAGQQKLFELPSAGKSFGRGVEEAGHI